MKTAFEHIEFLDCQIASLEHEREQYMAKTIHLREERARAVARLEMELELWRAGRLKPTE